MLDPYRKAPARIPASMSSSSALPLRYECYVAARKTDCRSNLTVDISFLSKEGSIQSH